MQFYRGFNCCPHYQGIHNGGMAQRMHAPSGCLGPLDFPSRQERFHTHLLDGKGARQV